MLTKRQEEVIKIAVKLSAKNNSGGVHYTEIARYLDISKWTAYDFLTDLTAKGYLVMERECKGADEERCAGRARVLFVPTKQTAREFAEDNTVWKMNYWLDKLTQCQQKGYYTVLREVVQELKLIRQPLMFCAGLILVMLLALKFLTASSGINLPYQFLVSLIGGETALAVFLGSTVMLVMQYNPQLLPENNLLPYLTEYELKMKMLGESELKSLQIFCREVFAELWPAHLNNLPVS